MDGHRRTKEAKRPPTPVLVTLLQYVFTALYNVYERVMSLVTWPFRQVAALVLWVVAYSPSTACEGDSYSSSSETDLTAIPPSPPTVDDKTLRRRARRDQFRKLQDDMDMVVGRLGQMEGRVRDLSSDQRQMADDVQATRVLTESAKAEAKKSRDDVRHIYQELEKFKGTPGNMTPKKGNAPQDSLPSRLSSSPNTPDSSSPSTPIANRLLPLPSSDTSQVTLKLSSFTRLQAANQPWYSPAFETSKGGHTMRLEVYPNGRDGLGTHISVYIFIVKGKNDDNIPWPFMGHVKVELLNQLNDSNHVSLDFGEYKALSPQSTDSVEMANSLGMPQFLPLSDLRFKSAKKCQFLKSDTLYFRVAVTVHTPPGEDVPSAL